MLARTTPPSQTEPRRELKEILFAKGYSIRRAARALGCHHVHLARFLSGARDSRNLESAIPALPQAEIPRKLSGFAKPLTCLHKSASVADLSSDVSVRAFADADALRGHGYTVRQAAEAISVPPSTLYAHLRGISCSARVEAALAALPFRMRPYGRGK